jgi:hypothetical protein
VSVLRIKSRIASYIKAVEIQERMCHMGDKSPKNKEKKKPKKGK